MTPGERFKLGMWVSRITSAPTLGYGIYGLVGDCKDYSEDGKPESGNKFVPNAIWTAVATIACLNAYGDWAYEIGPQLSTWAANKAQDYTARALEMGLGPYVDRMRHIVSRRDNFPPLLLEGRDHILRRAEDHLSGQLGVEVRHIGFWDGSMPGQPAKRNENEEVEYPVFGLQHDGQDFHVALIGQDPETNYTVIKLGNGPGPQTAQNEGRLQGRAARYNAQVFDRGGIDGIGKSGVQGDGGMQLDPGNPADIEWLRGQLTCSMEVDGQRGDHPGLWWQIYDKLDEGTLAAGAISAFTPEKPSLIQWLNIEGSLDVYEQCLHHDEL